MLHLLFVSHHKLVVLLQVLIAATTHLLTVQTGLATTIALIHLGLEDAELVELSLTCLPQTAVAVGTMLEAEPEVGVFGNDLCIVADGTTQVTRLLQQQGAVEEGHEVVGLQLQDEVEVLDATIIIAHLGAQQTTVVVPKEVIGIEVEGCVIVGHRTTQVILIEAGQSAIDVADGMLGQQMDGLVEEVLGIFPLLTRQTDDGASCPRLTIVRVYLECAVEGGNGARRVLLQQTYLRLHGVTAGILRPARQHRVELLLCHIIFFVLDITEGAIVPEALILRVVAQRMGIVGSRLGVVFQADAADGAQLVDARDIGVTLQGLAAVGLSTRKVVKIELGNAAIEPRLVEIGFGGNGLIEILHGEDIVLIVKRRPTYVDEAVDVVLGIGRERGEDEK